MSDITLQLFNKGKWWDAARLNFKGERMSDGVTLTYSHEYLKDIPHYGVSDCWACSVNAPVTVAPIDYPNWPALLDDLLPVGNAVFNKICKKYTIHARQRYSQG